MLIEAAADAQQEHSAQEEQVPAPRARSVPALGELPQELIDLICSHLPPAWKATQADFSPLYRKSRKSPEDLKNARLINRAFAAGAAGQLFFGATSTGRSEDHARFVALSQSRLASCVRAVQLDAGVIAKKARPGEGLANKKMALEFPKALARFVNLTTISFEDREHRNAATDLMKIWLASLNGTQFPQLRRVKLCRFTISKALCDTVSKLTLSMVESKNIRANLAGIKELRIVDTDLPFPPCFPDKKFTLGDWDFISPYLVGLKTLFVRNLPPPSTVGFNQELPLTPGLKVLKLSDSSIATEDLAAMLKHHKATLCEAYIIHCRQMKGSWGFVFDCIRNECRQIVEFELAGTPYRSREGVRYEQRHIFMASGEVFGINRLSESEMETLHKLGTQIDDNRALVGLDPKYHPLVEVRDRGKNSRKSYTQADSDISDSDGELAADQRTKLQLAWARLTEA